MKFCFTLGKVNKDTPIDDWFTGLDKLRLLSYLTNEGMGAKMHLIIRPRPGFDVERKRNYFHGPMLDWICKTLRARGIPASREPMREELKRMFIGEDENGKPLSATLLEIKVEGDPRDPETKYGEFISDVRRWCIDNLGSEPPLPDEVDLDEDSTKCAYPEKI